MPRPRRKAEDLQWRTVSSYQGWAVVGDRMVLYVVAPVPGVRWGAVALLTSAATAGDIDAVLADHAHARLGEFDTEEEARGACVIHLSGLRAGGEQPAVCGCPGA